MGTSCPPPTVGEINNVVCSKRLHQLPGEQVAWFLKGFDNREVLHAAPPKSAAVQMHLSPRKMQAFGMALRERTQSGREGECEASPGSARYYYPLLSNSGPAFAPTARSYIKLLALELVERLGEHQERWRERPTKLVLSWETRSEFGSDVCRRST